MPIKNVFFVLPNRKVAVLLRSQMVLEPPFPAVRVKRETGANPVQTGCCEFLNVVISNS